MTVFPFFQKIDHYRFLLIGGGSVATQKARCLFAFTSRVTVIAPTLTEELAAMVRKAEPEAEWKKKEAECSDLLGVDAVVLAVGDRVQDELLARACKKQGIPVNVADVPELCSFYFPAIIKKGPLVAAISTSGESPAYAAMLRREIEALIPDDIESVLEEMGHLRSELKQLHPGWTQKERGAFLKEELARRLSAARDAASLRKESLRTDENEESLIPQGNRKNKNETDDWRTI
jgi:precorrin-2 dehydrogenase/sirohydrochlorin ferrochelatase